MIYHPLLDVQRKAESEAVAWRIEESRRNEEHRRMLRNPKLKDFGITVDGIERVYVAFTKGEARAMAKRELGMTISTKHKRLPAHVEVRELGKQLTQAQVSA